MEAIRARLLIRGTCDSFVALRSASAAAHVCCKRKQLSIPFGLIGVSMVETKFSALVSTSGACRTKHKISKDEKRAYHQALNIEDTCQYFIVFGECIHVAMLNASLSLRVLGSSTTAHVPNSLWRTSQNKTTELLTHHDVGDFRCNFAAAIAFYWLPLCTWAFHSIFFVSGFRLRTDSIDDCKHSILVAFLVAVSRSRFSVPFTSVDRWGFAAWVQVAPKKHANLQCQ